MAKIQYEDKVSTRTSLLPRKNSATAADFTEIKNSVNALYDNSVYTIDLMSVLTVDFYAPNKIKILGITLINGVGTVTAYVNDVEYDYVSEIETGSKITITAGSNVVCNLTILNVY